MKIYVSLPITGHNLEERIAYAKRQVQNIKDIFYCGEECMVFNPLAGADPNNQKSYEYYMGKDIYLLSLCDIIIFCPGWATSTGCKMEYWFAMSANITMLEITDEGWVRPCKYELEENDIPQHG